MQSIELRSSQSLALTCSKLVLTISEQRIDFRPVLAGELYAPLRDVELFNEVTLDPEVHTLVWPNRADFDPATLHDWPELKEAMIERAKRWELVLASS
jgi:hypothetical protein